MLLDEKKAVIEVTVTLEYLTALLLRQAVGLQIDSETAEVEWIYAEGEDPYNDGIPIPKECHQVGREYFAHAPGSDVWVWFNDLPEATVKVLWEKHKSKLAFPAGLWEPEVVPLSEGIT